MYKNLFLKGLPVLMFALVLNTSCNNTKTNTANNDTLANKTPQTNESKFLSKPLVTNIYTADPSAHVFNGRIYVYPSHDIDAGIPEDDNGAHFAMRDYHILS